MHSHANCANCLDDSQVFEGSGCFLECEVAVLAQTLNFFSPVSAGPVSPIDWVGL